MATDFKFRKTATSKLTVKKGVYILADLDNVPIYVGQSTAGIRKRVQRHLTSARSDVIANRQIDVWEVAFVWEYPCDVAGISDLESALYHHFDKQSRLMNGTIPAVPPQGFEIPEPANVVQVMSSEEIAERLSAEQRLPRQAEHYAQLVGHFVFVKNSEEIKRAMNAHFERTKKYHQQLCE